MSFSIAKVTLLANVSVEVHRNRMVNCLQIWANEPNCRSTYKYESFIFVPSVVVEQRGKKNINYHKILQASTFLLIFVAFFSLFFSISVQGASTASTNDGSYSWPMFHYDLGRTGFTESPAPTTNNLLWRFRTQDTVDSSPAVVDGIVYICSRDGKIYALNATTGDEVWSYKTGNWFFFDSPAVADGKVFIGSGDQRVYSFDARNGTVFWKFKMGWEIASSPAVVDGIVFIGGADKYVYALNETTGELYGVLEPSVL